MLQSWSTEMFMKVKETWIKIFDFQKIFYTFVNQRDDLMTYLIAIAIKFTLIPLTKGDSFGSKPF